MSDPSQDPDKSKSENLFKPSPKIMALRKKQQPLGLPNPGKNRYLFFIGNSCFWKPNSITKVWSNIIFSFC
jgi:hypothetical protein